MSLWSLWSAPLFMSNDLGAISATSKALLLNRELLAVDQDSLGRMGTRFSTDLGPKKDVSGAGQGWRKDLDDGDVAVVIHNPGEVAAAFYFEAAAVGFAPDTEVQVRDMLAQKTLGQMRFSLVTEAIAPHGVAALRLSFAPKYPLMSTEL
eukprot:SAG31_NODE_5170_length_2701_cov_3.885473_5_plen_150_part_00